MYYYTLRKDDDNMPEHIRCWFVGANLPERLGYVSPIEPKVGRTINFTGFGGKSSAVIHSITQHSSPSESYLEIKLA